MCHYTLLPKFEPENEFKSFSMLGCKLKEYCRILMDVKVSQGSLIVQIVFYDDGNLLPVDDTVRLPALSNDKIQCIVVPYVTLLSNLEPLKPLCEYLETIFVQSGNLSISLENEKAVLCLAHPLYQARAEIPTAVFREFFEPQYNPNHTVNNEPAHGTPGIGS